MKYLIFESIHKVMKAEKLLLNNKIKIEIVPIPKEFSSNCGMSIKIDTEKVDLKKIKKILKDNKLEFKIC